MLGKLWTAGGAMIALLGTAPPAAAGGNNIAIADLRGRVEVKSTAPGARWRPARRGELRGNYLLRTGRGAWVRLHEQGGWVPRRLDRACVDGNSLLWVSAPGCGFRIEVLRGRVSAADGRRGRSLFRSVGG